MPKILCIFGMVLSLILLIVFIIDISAGIPFARANIVLDVVMIVGSILLALMGFLTLRELNK